MLSRTLLETVNNGITDVCRDMGLRLLTVTISSQTRKWVLDTELSILNKINRHSRTGYLHSYVL